MRYSKKIFFLKGFSGPFRRIYATPEESSVFGYNSHLQKGFRYYGAINSQAVVCIEAPLFGEVLLRILQTIVFFPVRFARGLADMYKKEVKAYKFAVEYDRYGRYSWIPRAQTEYQEIADKLKYDPHYDKFN